MRLGAAIVLLLLAGCAGQAGREESTFANLVEGTEVEVETTARTGAVKGIVVDPAIRPLTDAVIKMGDQETRSDDGGGFGFSDVSPGSHFLDVRKEGYDAARLVVEVAADKEPPWTRVVLVPVPNAAASYELLNYAGVIGSSVIVGAGGFRTGYTAWDPITGANMNHQWELESPVDFLQLEFVWEPNLPAFGDLWAFFSVANETSNSGGSVGEVTGSSPLILPVTREQMENVLSGTASHGRFVIFAGYDPTAPASVSIALQQTYDAYLHVFHNYVPPPDWAFVTDGPPPI